MAESRLQIPTGMQDTLPGECAGRRALEAFFRRLFAASGYREIETPVLEFYGALDDQTYGYRPEHVWKTFDRVGRVLALRPDSTIPAARLAAGTLANVPLPLRISYLQSACKFQSDTLSLLCEQPQAGVELMGEGGEAADAEVISLAVDCLRASGLRGWQIELGHAGFLNGFLREAALTPDQLAAVRELMACKDTQGIRQALAGRVPPETAERLAALPLLLGGAEVLDEAERLTADPECRAATESLRRIVALLRAFGCEATLTFDLAMAQEAGYYSGVIFRAHAAGVGQPVLSGGRYDGLVARFGRDLPAVGFALNTKTLLIALEAQGERFAPPALDWLVAADEAHMQAAVRRAVALRADGARAALCFGATREALQERLDRRDAAGAIRITDQGEEVLTPCPDTNP